MCNNDYNGDRFLLAPFLIFTEIFLFGYNANRVRVESIHLENIVNLKKKTMIVQLISDLMTVSGAQQGDICVVLGYNDKGDGGGGHFYWDSASSAPLDGGLYFKGALAAGRWIRLFDGPINVRWFGATGKNSTLDTLGFRRSIAPSRSVVVPAGSYLINDTIEINAPKFSFIGDGSGSTLINFIPDTGNKPCFLFKPLNDGQGKLEANKFCGFSITTAANNTKQLTAVQVLGNFDGTRIRVTKFSMQDVYVLPAFTNQAGTCIGVDINGCEASTFKEIQSWADFPVVLGSDIAGTTTNGGGDIDVTTFSDLYLVSNGAQRRPCVYIRRGTSLSNVVFDGTHDYAGGSNGILWDRSQNSSAVLSASNVSFQNIRVEQSSDANNYAIYLHGGNTMIDRVMIKNCVLGSQNGIYLRNVRHISIVDSTVGIAYGNAVSPLVGINIDGCETLKTFNVIPQQLATAIIANMVIRSADVVYYKGTSFPVTAEYMMPSMDVQENIPIYLGQKRNAQSIPLETGSSYRLNSISVSRTLSFIQIIASNASNTINEWGTAAIFGIGKVTRMGGSANFFVGTTAAPNGIGILYDSTGFNISNNTGQNITVLFYEDYVLSIA